VRRATVSKVQDVNDDSRDAIIRQARIALGSRLREIRESRGMTQTAVATQAGLSRSYYAQVEHARQAISVDRAFAIANVLGVEMTELFTDFPAVPHARPY
jgi:transcriptional regulator with XRE-family HTH domain